MSRLDGPEVVREINTLNPNTKVMVMTRHH
jgi:hypothetical protein